jgi:hypothetical protein
MALVITSYEPKPEYKTNPLVTSAGQELKIVRMKDEEWQGWVLCENHEGTQGWVPENILKIVKDTGVVQEKYEARELSAIEGEIVRIEKLESGWAWVTNMTNDSGWVPMKNLKLVD